MQIKINFLLEETQSAMTATHQAFTLSSKTDTTFQNKVNIWKDVAGPEVQK